MTKMTVILLSFALIFFTFIAIDCSPVHANSLSNALSILEISDKYMLRSAKDKRRDDLPFATISYAQTLDGSMYSYNSS